MRKYYEKLINYISVKLHDVHIQEKIFNAQIVKINYM